MIEVLRALNEVSSGMVFPMGLMMMFAFWRLKGWSSGETRHFALCVFWLSATLTWRLFYWDLLPAILGEAWWAWLRDMLEGKTINAFWNMTFFLGAYHGLRGLSLCIPQRMQQRWPWWKVWGYPPFSYSFGNLKMLIRLKTLRRDR